MEHVSRWKCLNELSCSWRSHQQQRPEENLLPVCAWLLNSDPYADVLLTNQASIRLINATSMTCCVHHCRAWKSAFIIKLRSVLFILHHSQNVSWQNLLFKSTNFQVPHSLDKSGKEKNLSGNIYLNVNLFHKCVYEINCIVVQYYTITLYKYINTVYTVLYVDILFLLVLILLLLLLLLLLL